MLAETPTIPTPLQRPRFVCTHCWWVFEDDRALTCPEPAGICRRPRPSGGWSTMPHRFRGKFMLTELLGRGGMGAVFRAWNLDHGREVALKVAQRVGSPDTQRQIRELFAHEAKQSAFLGTYSKQYVAVSGFDADAFQFEGASDQVAYLEMEYVQLPTLHQLLKETPMVPLRVARIGAALAASLIPMHQHRLVHRDLKPGNIFLFEGGLVTEVRFFDFGLCVSEGADPDRTSFAHLYPMPNMIPGTDGYMSPEQMERQPLYVESDIHAIGSILWRLSSKNVPFPAVGKTQAASLEYRKKLIRTIPQRPESMPEELYEIIKMALNPDPEKRFPKRPNDPKDYTPAMGLKLALQDFADGYVRKRREQTQRSKEALLQLTDRTQQCEGKVEKIVQLADQVHRLLGELKRLTEELSDDEGASHISTTGVVDEISRQVESLEHEISLVIRHGEQPPKNRLMVWIPWALAGVAVLAIAALAAKSGGGNEVSGGTPITTGDVVQTTQMVPKAEPPPPVGRPDAGAPGGGDLAGEPVDSPTGNAKDPKMVSPPPDTATQPPKCTVVPVTLKFDLVAKVKMGDRVWDRTDEVTVDVTIGGADIVVNYQEIDSVGDPSSVCKPQQKKFAVNDLVDGAKCEAKEVKTMEVCPRIR